MSQTASQTMLSPQDGPNGDVSPSVPTPTNNGDGLSSANGNDESLRAVNEVLQSDIGINTLLTRLKQSIASARDFATFLKKRASQEETHAQDLKKLCKTTHDNIRGSESRQGSYAQQYDEVMRLQERMADNDAQFAISLQQMHEDLLELATNVERGRKQWKHTGLSAEKRVQDAELAMEKAKAKYDSLAEDYDRTRTGDKQAGRVFGLKGPKSAAQHEEDLLKKVQAADSDYASKVQSAHSQRQELLSTLRPQAVKALQDLVVECDSALSLQLQKYASFNEKLLLNNGTIVAPLPQLDGQPSKTKSLKDVVYQINNDRDFKDYILSHSSKVPPKPAEIKYQRHPTLAPAQQTPIQQPQQPYHQPQQSRQSQQFSHPPIQVSPPSTQQTPQSPSQGFSAPPPQPRFPNQPSQFQSNIGPPQISSPKSTQVPPSLPPPTSIPMNSGPTYGSDLPPLKPVFGVSLDTLFRRDGSAVPMVVYQCLQAVDLYGLDVEGIYRLSGTASHISKLRNVFDHDASQVDFRNPENFFHDVNSVAGLLKQFFRDLLNPLLTSEHYSELVNAARIDDDILRRDSLHAIINSLPDPNYATLRALTLHLYRVQEHSESNRMNSGNLAICFGPTLMGSNTGQNIADAGWQVRVIDTILQNTYQIFDED